MNLRIRWIICNQEHVNSKMKGDSVKGAAFLSVFLVEHSLISICPEKDVRHPVRRSDHLCTDGIYQVLPEIIELWGLNVQTHVEGKKLRATDREMTTPLLLLRAVQLGVQIGEMNLLAIGTINDMYTEMQNDENQGAYNTLASQDDMDAF